MVPSSASRWPMMRRYETPCSRAARSWGERWVESKDCKTADVRLAQYVDDREPLELGAQAELDEIDPRALFARRRQRAKARARRRPFCGRRCSPRRPRPLCGPSGGADIRQSGRRVRRRRSRPRPARSTAKAMCGSRSSPTKQIVELVGEAEIFEMLEHAAEVRAALFGEKVHRARAVGEDCAARFMGAGIIGKRVRRAIARGTPGRTAPVLAQIRDEFALEALFASLCRRAR